MALINRVSRIFKADFHAVLDQIEEPEQLLKQAIRDMENDLAGSEQSIANSLHQQDVMAARRDEIHTSVKDLDEQLDLCFESGKEDLSRSLIRKKLETERLLKQLISKYESNASQLKETTMKPGVRTLLKVVLDEDQRSEVTDAVNALMGSKPEARFRFVQEHAAFADDLDI